MREKRKRRKRVLLPREVGAILNFTRGEDQGRKVPLVFVRSVVGRKVGDVLVRDLQVSSSHAAVVFTGQGFRLIDLESSNGTFVRKKQIREIDLTIGEEVRIGGTSFQIDLDPEEATKLLAKNPINPSLSEGGMTELIEAEFFGSPTSDLEPTMAMKAEEPGEATLEVSQGVDRGKSFSLKKNRLVIGRVGADINLSDADISRKHAMLERQSDQRLLLRDLSSTNGTFVNERAVTNCLLKTGDQIKVGKTILIYRERGAS